MRTLRFTLAGTVILALLGGVGGAVLAQEESPGASPAAMAPVLFTGGATCGFGPAEEWLADDPRVTGPCSMTIEQEGGDLPGGFVAVGDYTVNGPEGDWVGTWSVMAFPPRSVATSWCSRARRRTKAGPCGHGPPRPTAGRVSRSTS